MADTTDSTDSTDRAAGRADLDLAPAAARVAALAADIRDDQLAAPTPCPGMAVRNMLGHVVGLAGAFRDAARKELGPNTAGAPDRSLPDIDDGGAWRRELPGLLEEMAAAWRDPAAWTGTTQVGGVTLPGAVTGRIGLNELVVHGWDLAWATGQPYRPGAAELDACREMLATFAVDRPADAPFGPAIRLPDGATLLDQVIALSGRDPRNPPPPSAS